MYEAIIKGNYVQLCAGLHTEKIPFQGTVPRGRQSSRIRSFPRWVWAEGQVGGWVGKPPGRREEEFC